MIFWLIPIPKDDTPAWPRIAVEGRRKILALPEDAGVEFERHEDIDLGVDADLPKMRTLAGALRGEGFAVDFHEPDGDDPLGGVIDLG